MSTPDERVQAFEIRREQRYQSRLNTGGKISSRDEHWHERFLQLYPDADLDAKVSSTPEYEQQIMGLILADRGDQRTYQKMLAAGWELVQVVPRSLSRRSTVIFRRPVGFKTRAKTPKPNRLWYNS